MAFKKIFRLRREGEVTALIAIILGFILLLVIIWLWYDLKLKALDGEIKSSPVTQP